MTKLHWSTKTGLNVLAIFVVIGIGLFIKVNYFEDGNYLVTSEAKVDHVVRFEAAGGNIRYYVLTPPRAENSHMACGIAAGENNSSQFCWTKQGWYLDPELGWREVRP